MTRVVCAGLATLDTIVATPSHPDAEDRVLATDLAVAGGGGAATAAVTLARLGVDVAFAGAVGDDEAGDAIRRGLAEEGVDVSELAVVPGARSPQSAILVGAGTRAIVHFPGTLPPLALSPRARALCRDAEWVHVDHVGYGATPAGVPLSVDAGNAIPELVLDGVALYAPTERSLVARYPALSVEAAARAALDEGAGIVVVTRGAEGSLAVTRDGVVGAPAVAVDAVSTLGAGDVFHGALLARLVAGDALADALAAANECAALSCRALDGRSAIPRRAHV